MKQILAIDFDGTITYENKYPEVGELRPKALEVIKRLKDSYTLILWTCREGKELSDALLALNENGIEFDYVNECPFGSRKVAADCYIDDMAFGACVDWDIIENKFLKGDDNV